MPNSKNRSIVVALIENGKPNSSRSTIISPIFACSWCATYKGCSVNFPSTISVLTSNKKSFNSPNWASNDFNWDSTTGSIDILANF